MHDDPNPQGTTDPLVAIPRWFRDVSPSIDEARLATLRSCVTGLASAGIELPVLVRAAHGVADGAALDALDTELLACTPTYAADRLKEELCRIAAAALIFVMLTPASGADERRAVLTALMVESAAFTGLVPVLPDLTTASKHCLDRSSRVARARLSNETMVKAVTKLASVPSDEGTPDEDRMFELIIERDRAINTMIARIEGLVRSFNERLDLMDEEVDVLWWARSGTAMSIDQSWAGLTPLDRAVVAAHEVKGLVKHQPPTRATWAVLAAVVDGAESSHPVVEVLAALDRHEIVLSDKTSGTLNPLANGLAAYRRLNGVADVVSGQLEAEGLFPIGTAVTAQAVAEELLREWAIEALK